MVGNAANVGTVVGGIMTATGAGAVAGSVVSGIGIALTGLSGLIPSDPNHGLTVTVTTTKWYRNKKNIPYRTTSTISRVWVY